MEESSDKLKAQEWHPLEIPELGIDFKRFKSKQITKFICTWHNDTDNHLYEIEVKHHPVGAGWMAVGYTDGNAIFTITATGRWLTTNMAIAAMRASLKHTHNHALKTHRKSLEAKEMPPSPMSLPPNPFEG